jgi:short subunit dehydrogenase-like uncharacterized protein
MNPSAEFDIIVYGSTGYTGRLVAEYLAQRYGVGGQVTWAMAGRSAQKLAEVRDGLSLPPETPLVLADAKDPKSLATMAGRAKAIITTVGPYQLYGDPLVEACVAAGTDCLDLTGEPNWMHEVIRRCDDRAKASGARIVHSCGFDSIPFELGVFFCEETAKAKLGGVVPRVKGRVRRIQGGLSGGTAASGRATMEAVQKNPALMGVLMDPFALTPGFTGPAQPSGQEKGFDEDVGAEVAPFMMAMINTKNVHRSNALMGHPYGEDFLYDEMSIVIPGAPADFSAMPEDAPKPGEGPTKAEREAGFFDILFVGIAKDGRKVKASVQGDRDPGYGSTSKMLAEAAVCLVKDAPDVAGGVWTPGAAMGRKLIDRLQANAGLTFQVEA